MRGGAKSRKLIPAVCLLIHNLFTERERRKRQKGRKRGRRREVERGVFERHSDGATPRTDREAQQVSISSDKNRPAGGIFFRELILTVTELM